MINDPLLPGNSSDVPPPPPAGKGSARRAPGAKRQKHPAMSARILALGISVAAAITITSNYAKAQKADEAAKAAAQAAADAAAKAAAEAAAQAAAKAAAEALAAAAAAAAANESIVSTNGSGQSITPNTQPRVVVTVPPAPANPGRASNSGSTKQRSSGSH